MLKVRELRLESSWFRVPGRRVYGSRLAMTRTKSEAL